MPEITEVFILIQPQPTTYENKFKVLSIIGSNYQTVLISFALCPNILSKDGRFIFMVLIKNTNLGNRLKKLPSYEMRIPLHDDKNSATVDQEVIYLLWRVDSFWNPNYYSSQISPVLSAIIIREGYTILHLRNTKTIMTDVQNASRSKRRVVPYSKDISETILLDSVIFHNVHILFYWIKQLWCLSGTAQQNIQSKKDYDLEKLLSL